MQLFEVAIIKKAKTAEDGTCMEAKILLPPTAIVATSSQNAAFKAIQSYITTEINIDEHEVLVRPFK